MSRPGDQRRCTTCRRLYMHRAGSYGLVCPHCNGGQIGNFCSDPDCMEKAHADGAPGCVSDPTCGGTRGAEIGADLRRAHQVAAQLWPPGRAQTSPPAFNPNDETHSALFSAAAFPAAGIAPPPPGWWERLARAAFAFAGKNGQAVDQPAPDLYREVPVLRRVRLVSLGRVSAVRPCPVWSGYEIELENARTVGVPLAAWICATPGGAGTEDRGRWPCRGWLGTRSLIVAGDGVSSVVAGDSLWLEVPADG